MNKAANMFKSYEPFRDSKLWGEELHIVNRLQHCGKILTVNPGFQCSIHYHRNKVETFYLLRGALGLELYERVDGESRSLRSLKLVGRKLLVRPLTVWPLVPHRFWAIDGPAEFLEVSSYDAASDSVRFTDSRRINRNPEVKGVW